MQNASRSNDWQTLVFAISDRRAGWDSEFHTEHPAEARLNGTASLTAGGGGFSAKRTVCRIVDWLLHFSCKDIAVKISRSTLHSFIFLHFIPMAKEAKIVFSLEAAFVLSSFVQDVDVKQLPPEEWYIFISLKANIDWVLKMSCLGEVTRWLEERRKWPTFMLMITHRMEIMESCCVHMFLQQAWVLLNQWSPVEEVEIHLHCWK